jgi:hypothetical protein
MALTVNDINILREYISGVMERADHHADNVSEISLALAGAIIWRKDDSAIKVMEHNGDTKNVLWVHINGKRYAFSYNHGKEQIEMREKSIQGKVMKTFTNATPISEIKAIFKSI